MNKKFIFGIIVAILLLMPLASASILSWLGDLFGITGKVTETTCTESDGGVDYYVKGYVTVDGVHEYWDSCDGDTIQETYCSPTMRTSYYECPNGCQDGACVRENAIYWKNVDNAVFEKDYLFPPSPATLHFHSLDKYTGWSTLGWFFGGNATYKDLNENNYDKAHPAVLSFEHSNFSAGSVSIVYDTDTSTGNVLTIYFPEIIVYSTTYPHPTPRLYVSECGSTYWWDKTHDGWGVWNESLRMNPEEAMIPEHLARASPTCGTTPCTDSDGGVDYYARGVIEQTQPDGGILYNYEICLDDGITVTEKYCDPTGEVGYEEYKCPYGCKDGACVKCTDSDGGKNYYVKGYTEGVDEEGNYWGKSIDFCQSDALLMEYSCKDNHDFMSSFECSYGCSDGACLKATETISVTLVEGEEITVTMAGIDYRINLLTVSSSTTATIAVDGASKEVSKGSIYSFADLQVYVKDVFYSTKAGELSSVDIDISVEAPPTPIPEPVPEPVPIPVPEICSELLIKQDLGDYKYSYSSGSTEVPVYSEKGIEIGMVQCCSAHYLDLDEMSSSAIVCPYDGREDLRNSFNWLMAREWEKLVLGEYKGQKAYWIPNRRDSEEVILWTHDKYLLAVNRDLIERKEQDIGTLLLPEAVADAYFERYPSDLGIACIDSDGGRNYYKKGIIYSIDVEGKEYRKEEFCTGGELTEHYCEMDKPASEVFTCLEGCKDGACLRTCPEITGWKIENGLCVSDSGCDYDPLKYVYYDTFEECQEHLKCVPEWECKMTPPFCPPSGKQTKTCKDVKCGTGKTEKEISCPAGQCSGCLYNTTCLPFGQRLKIRDISAYCSIDNVFRPQMSEGAACENNYECLSNECSNGKCISTYSLLEKILELLKIIVGKGWLWGK